MKPRKTSNKAILRKKKKAGSITRLISSIQESYSYQNSMILAQKQAQTNGTEQRAQK